MKPTQSVALGSQNYSPAGNAPLDDPEGRTSERCGRRGVSRFPLALALCKDEIGNDSDSEKTRYEMGVVPRHPALSASLSLPTGRETETGSGRRGWCWTSL